jgi:hypothetical protein
LVYYFGGSKEMKKRIDGSENEEMTIIKFRNKYKKDLKFNAKENVVEKNQLVIKQRVPTKIKFTGEIIKNENVTIKQAKKRKFSQSISDSISSPLVIKKRKDIKGEIDELVKILQYIKNKLDSENVFIMEESIN